MTDAYAVFKADPGRQNTLKTIWPDLYNALARLDEPAGGRVIRCAVHPARLAAPEWTGRPLAVARLGDKYGHAACRACLDSLGGQGYAGFPLKIERP